MVVISTKGFVVHWGHTQVKLVKLLTFCFVGPFTAVLILQRIKNNQQWSFITGVINNVYTVIYIYSSCVYCYRVMWRDRLCLPATPALPVLQSLQGFVWPVPINATTGMISLNCIPKGILLKFFCVLAVNWFKFNSPVFFYHLLVICPFSVLFFFCCRNFRCDCGNRKFGEFKCQLIPVSPLVLILFLTESVSPSLSVIYVLTDEGIPSIVFAGQRWRKQPKSLQSQLQGLLLHMWPTISRHRWSGISFFILSLGCNVIQIIGMKATVYFYLSSVTTQKTPFGSPNRSTMRWFSVSSVRIGFMAG